MTASALLAHCARLGCGITVTSKGDELRVRGPKDARAELKPLVLEHKAALLALLRSPGLPGTASTTTSTTARGLAPSPTHQRDWAGRWVDLAGLHGGGDALPN
jgi:hypothetical protein